MLVGRFQLRSHKMVAWWYKRMLHNRMEPTSLKQRWAVAIRFRSSSIPVPDMATVDKRSLVIVHVAHNGMCWTLPTAALSGCFARFG